ncbi:glycosyltransferase [Acinetobacter pittii]|uniref:glycosyltransferase n=1 Tax=Acinetobacter pittii TaxID=48296 RepID=UPI001C235633|nr:glycosyltransferase [Acinetobacter pittii]QXA07125.1 glycosyltransferase [Acinetobacter pittii]
MDEVFGFNEKRKLIVHVITNLSGIGGAEMMLSRLVKQTNNHCEHIIISLMEISDIYKETLSYCHSYYALNWNGINTIKIIFELKQIIKKISPTNIQCWMYHANVLTTISQLGVRNKPNIFWGIHHSLSSLKEESISTKIGLFLSKYLASKATGIIYCAYSSLVHHEKFGLKNINTQVIPNGVFLDQFSLNSQLHEQCIVGFAGRYHAAKGYPYLFSVISKLKDFPIIFKIAGSGANLRNEEIAKYFNQYDLDQNKVILLDQVSNMPDFYRSVDIFLMTSITEGFPNVLLEAMASGLPCVTTDVGDSKYIVEDCGYVLPVRDVLGIKEAILNYLYLDQENKQKLKYRARKRIEENFSIQYVSDKYLSTWR